MGFDDLEVEILGYSMWGNNKQYATNRQKRRAFCAGDAMHKHPPSHGLGPSTSIQDAYNLAWKLTAAVKGQAREELPETYSVQRAPVAKQIVTLTNDSGREYQPFFDALGVTNATTDEVLSKNPSCARKTLPEGATRRKALRAALDNKDHE